MSVHKELMCEVEELREQLLEVILAVQTLREIAAENEDSISTNEVLLQLSGLPHSTKCESSHQRSNVPKQTGNSKRMGLAE